MSGVRFYPDFRFPSNVVHMPFEFPEIRKSADVKKALSLLMKS
jgi:hypothetical protein